MRYFPWKTFFLEEKSLHVNGITENDVTFI